MPRLFTIPRRLLVLRFEMFSRLKNCNKIFVTAFIPGFAESKLDNVDPNTKTSKKMLEEFDEKPISGMDRIYMMFTTDEFGEPSPEIVNIGNVMILSIVVGSIIGGFMQSRVAFLDFVDRNDASAFTSHIEAKKRLQDKVTTGFARGAFQYAWRLTSFTGLYTLTSTTISVYRGKYGILEHVTAGLITGASYKCNLGLRGIVVGGSLGMFLGTMAGFSFWVIKKATGISFEDAIKFSHMAKKSRDDTFNKAIEDHLKKKEPALTQVHDSKPGIVDNLDDINANVSK